MTSVHIREARPEDHPQIRELAPELTTGMPQWRSADAQRAAVAAAEDWVRRRGLATMSLETGAANRSARALYSHLGYVEEEVTLTKRL